MNSKVYDLMNWPEIEGITYADCTNPGELLGGHACRQGFLIQIFRPDAVEVIVTTFADNKKHVCEKVDEAGYFAVLISSKRAVKYSVTVEDVSGQMHTYYDPYSFNVSLKAADKKKFLAGTAFNAYEYMGAHITEIDGIEGTLFTVWAPNARRVSVVGDFNNWDGRICQMNSDDAGIFQLFIPGITDTQKYCYEIKLKDGQTVKKADPYYTGDNNLECEYIWDDDSWSADFAKDKPLAICELDAEAVLAKDCVEKVKNMGFNCVELSGIVSSIDMEDGISAGNMCVNLRIESDLLKSVIDEFHKNGIAVIMDCNLAFMEQGLGSFVYYDGTHLYDVCDTDMANHPELKCSSYDYSKPQVRSYLYSTVDYWVKQFKVDGIRMLEVASMLYLDYGKNAGEWKTNIYGGKENLDAIEFIKGIRKYIDKLDRQVLMIAEESSIWTMVTGDIKHDGLGFDYQWNDGWKKDFMDFYMTDPLFRKGKYDKLTYSMLYQYSEDFIVEFSRDGYGWERGLLVQSAPVPENMEEDAGNVLSKAHAKNAIAYMYAYPGKKLVNYRECEGIEDYIAALNKIYTGNAALYELDNNPNGFTWVNDNCSDETVLSFARIAADDSMVLCAANFTPVERKDFKMGVPREGKYIDASTGVVYKSVCDKYDGMDNSILLKLAGLDVCFLVYEPYTDIEKKENAIIYETKAALEQAKQKAMKAKEIEEEARLTAQAAKEAEQKAYKAAIDAANASKEAEKQADEARKRCEQIELDAKKKLDALKKIK